MAFLDEHLPKNGESLAEYLRRVRASLKLSQGEMAKKAGVHIQSLGKIESGKTTRLSSKTRMGLARVLGIPEDYLDAVCRGVPLTEVQALKICPKCWTPGTEAESIWLDRRSKYCFICGSSLGDRAQFLSRTYPLPQVQILSPLWPALQRYKVISQLK